MFSCSQASVCMERVEDAKALASYKNLRIHGRLITICREEVWVYLALFLAKKYNYLPPRIHSLSSPSLGAHGS